VVGIRAGCRTPLPDGPSQKLCKRLRLLRLLRLQRLEMSPSNNGIWSEFDWPHQ